PQREGGGTLGAEGGRRLARQVELAARQRQQPPDRARPIRGAVELPRGDRHPRRLGARSITRELCRVDEQLLDGGRVLEQGALSGEQPPRLTAQRVRALLQLRGAR